MMKNNYKDFRSFYKSENPYRITILDDMVSKNGIGLTPYVVKQAEQNMVTQDIFSVFLENRIIFMGQEFTDDAANIIIAQLLYLNKLDSQDKIEIEINSPGGDILALRGILSVMDAISNPVATTCIAEAASCASVLLCSGEKGMRKALKYSYILVHQALSSTGNRMVQSVDFERQAKFISTLNNDIANIFVERTGLDKDSVLKAMDRDNWIRPEQAIPGKEWGPYGIIDEIVTKI